MRRESYASRNQGCSCCCWFQSWGRK
ncbi:unnamed protein product [Acanthoscelides obtectus]|uniref:Uncharacterized protein n=1 Tax=Acanthoscelides obtectus TaxID=200917 RepID=A0A9P0KLJ0_ACAOB|nr:unnamed protein product [Acanthoscelides obtectus]CAK1638643.1 hypothetical protein AOBTE_LOCUS10727 [Acanthoscelides obtectus]